jgi:hypothetical protein
MLTHRASAPFTNRYFAIAFAVAMAITAGTLTLRLSREHATARAAVAAVDERAVPATLEDRRSLLERTAAETLRARTDMFAHAMRHGMAVEAEHTFGPVADFDANWNLYYAELETPEGMITLYTAVSRRDSSVRYTATWDHLHGQPRPWERVLP